MLNERLEFGGLRVRRQDTAGICLTYENCDGLFVDSASLNVPNAAGEDPGCNMHAAGLNELSDFCTGDPQMLA